MKVRMVQQVSGSRNGEPWPEPGVEIDLPDVEARAAIQGGVAVPTDYKADEILVPPAGVHTPGRTAYGDVNLVSVPADAVADPQGAKDAHAAMMSGKTAKSVPAGTGVQNADGTAMNADAVDKSLADDEQTAKDLGLPSPQAKAPAGKATASKPASK